MSVLTVKEYFKAKDIDPDTLWRQCKDADGEWWQSIDVEHMLAEFAKMYTLQVVREAVEDELESLDTAKIISTESELILCRDVAIRMLTRIESKLEES